MYSVEFEERALNVTKEFFYASGIVVSCTSMNCPLKFKLQGFTGGIIQRPNE